MKSKQSEQFVDNLGSHYQSNTQFVSLFEFCFITCIVLCINFSISPVIAQPSGGPYGPIRQSYDLPSEKGKTYYVATDGKADQSGETLSNPTTIEAAIERVNTGDVIVMRGGTYRTGNLILNQGITIQPYADEQPILKGTFVATKWENLGNGLWVTSWSRLFPAKPDDWWQRKREVRNTPLCIFNNDMVFADGKFLQAVGWAGSVNQNTYYIDYETGLVYIGVNPQNHLIEITAFNSALIRTTKDIHGKTSDHKGPVIQGITFTQYAYRAIEIEGTDPVGLSPEANHGKEVLGTTIENCTISFCSRVAGYFRGDHLTIRHCKVSDTSTEGLYIIGSADVLLEKNIFTRNNIEQITGYYPAAVKIFDQCYRCTCRDNLVIDLPYSNGIWYDVGNVDGRFINNYVIGVGDNKIEVNKNQLWPSSNGFFFEISKGAICAGNVFVNCDHGIMILNSSNVQIYQNTFVNSIACIGRNGRSAVGDHFGWHPSTGPDVDKREGHIFVNNLLTGDENFKRPLMFVWQPDSMCKKLKNPMLKQFDYNVFVNGSDSVYNPLIYWSPAVNNNCQLISESLGDIQKLYPEFLTHSRYLPNYNGPLFKGFDLGNYHLLQAFPGSDAAASLPSEISELLGQSKRFIGAYLPIP
jgi:parallel beta-helix repeat protein